MMDNEKVINDEKNEFYENKIKFIISKLNKKGIKGYYAADKSEAIKTIETLISEFCMYNKEHYENSSNLIGMGDSLTLHEISLFELLSQMEDDNKIKVINPFERMADGRYVEFKDIPNGWVEDPTEYEKAYIRVMEKMRKALLSDVFISSANAITMQGQIVNTDGVGNRVAGICFGPYKVLLVIGRNKIVNNLDEAYDRVKNICAPLNHLRHAKKHSRRNPDGTYLEQDSLYQLSNLACVRKGHCLDCGSPNCSRRVTITLESGTGGSLRDRIHVLFINEDLGI